MINSKLIRILSIFSSEELKRLEWFVKSVFYNENENVIQLFLYLRKLSPTWNPEKLARNKVWKKAFPNTPFNEVYCRKVMSNLVLIMIKYITNELDFSAQSNISRLCNFYLSRYLTKDAESCMKEWEDEQKNCVIQNADFYLTQMELLRTKTLIPVPLMQLKSTSLITDLIEASDIHYMISQLQWQTLLRNNTHTYAFGHTSSVVDAILKRIEKENKWLAIPAIYIYYHLFKMVEQPEESHFYDKLNEAIQQYFAVLSSQEWVNILFTLQNYCIRKVIAGEDIFKEKLHLLYIDNLKTGLIFSYNQLKPETFKNIVRSALSFQKSQWAVNFVEEYKERLPDEQRENLLAYCFALISFEAKRFSEALAFLNETIKTPDIFQELQFKTLRIKCFYELQDFDSMNAGLDALRMQLARQANLSDFYRIRYKNFGSFLHKVCYLPKMDKEQWLKLNDELAEKNPQDLLDKKWLMVKIAEKRLFC
jgi:hypothetical protein